MRIDNVAPQISAITFRRFREEDARVLKTIASLCSDLKKIHIEFSNKIDLFNFKDLIDFLDLVVKTDIVNFTLKIRT